MNEFTKDEAESGKEAYSMRRLQVPGEFSAVSQGGFSSLRTILQKVLA